MCLLIQLYIKSFNQQWSIHNPQLYFLFDFCESKFVVYSRLSIDRIFSHCCLRVQTSKSKWWWSTDVTKRYCESILMFNSFNAGLYTWVIWNYFYLIVLKFVTWFSGIANVHLREIHSSIHLLFPDYGLGPNSNSANMKGNGEQEQNL